MELQRFELRDTHQMLEWAFQVLRECGGAINYAEPSGESSRSVTERMLRFAEAAKVIACVDRLDPIERALIRLCYLGEHDRDWNAYYNQLHNYVRRSLASENVKKRDTMRANLEVLTLKAVWEITGRTAGHKIYFNAAHLAAFIEVSEPNWSKNYKKEWDKQLEVLERIRIRAYSSIDDWLITIIERRRQEKPRAPKTKRPAQVAYLQKPTPTADVTTEIAKYIGKDPG